MVAASPRTSIPGPLRRFTVQEYHRLVDAGVLDPDERVELLDGWIVAKMTRKPPHDAVVDRAAELLRDLLPAGLRVRVQSAITTSDSEPEPDLAVVRGRALDYVGHHPRPAEVAMIVEVADTSLDRDRAKAAIYARAGVPVYWIVNLAGSRIEVYEGPSGPTGEARYHGRKDHGRDANVPVVLDGQTVGDVAAADLLPR